MPKEEKTVQEQQRILSILLLKLLYTISKKTSLEIDTDDPNVVTAYFNPPVPEDKKRRPRRKPAECGAIEIGIGDDSEPIVIYGGNGHKRGRKSGSDDEDSVYIFAPQTRLFDVFEESNGEYSIRLQNGKRQLVNFRYPESDGTNSTFFTINGCNYLQVLYNLRDPRTALKDLAGINTRISLKDIKAWDEAHMAVIKYLQTLALQL